MLHHEPLRPPLEDYPPDEWNLIEQSFRPEYIAQMEAVLALGNGVVESRRFRLTKKSFPIGMK